MLKSFNEWSNMQEEVDNYGDMSQIRRATGETSSTATQTDANFLEKGLKPLARKYGVDLDNIDVNSPNYLENLIARRKMYMEILPIAARALLPEFLSGNRVNWNALEKAIQAASQQQQQQSQMQQPQQPQQSQMQQPQQPQVQQ